jgi:signal transduction histidine kinase
LVHNQLAIAQEGAAYDGAPGYVLPIISLIFFALILLSRAGLFRLTSYILIGIYSVCALYTIYVWGVGVPIGLLTFVLVLIMSSVLIGTRFSRGMAAGVVVLLLLVHYLQQSGWVTPVSSWRTHPWGIDDTILVMVMMLVVFMVAWLSDREMERALRHALESEAALQQQRDALETTVEERTAELKRAQLEKVVDLYRQADFGRLATGLLHDLVTPLNVISLNLEQLQADGGLRGKEREVKALLQRAIRGAKSMEHFVAAVREQLHQKETRVVFDPERVIQQVMWLLAPSAQAAGVTVQWHPGVRGTRLFGNPVKFHQLVTNLVANAIDSYEGMLHLERVVNISLRHQPRGLYLVVEDKGVGIPSQLLEKIFEPFFTTKKKGTGVGLSICREIMIKEFRGTMTVTSQVGQGTQFTIVFPLE